MGTFADSLINTPPQAPSYGGSFMDQDASGSLMPTATNFINPTAAAGVPDIVAPTAVAPSGGGFGDWMENSGMLNKTDADGNTSQGWGSMAINGAQAFGNLWLGSQQLGMAKDALKQSKREFKTNNNNQVQMVNNQLAGRANEMAAASGDGSAGGYKSAEAYVDAKKLEKI